MDEKGWMKPKPNKYIDESNEAKISFLEKMGNVDRYQAKLIKKKAKSSQECKMGLYYRCSRH